MIFVNNCNFNPYFNIASEEYLLKEFDEEFLMLWRSNASVVVGKHQILTSEANQQYCFTNSIDIIRRISGGGTVFHDSGNINFTIITKSNNPSINFKEHTEPVVLFLKELGLNAGFEGKNDIRLNGLKVSGNAAHIYKNKILYHGTLLFNTDLKSLSNSIQPTSSSIESRAIQSNRSEVANINAFLKNLTLGDFLENLKKFLLNWYEIKNTISFSEEDIAKINKLVADKYETKEWNYLYSPDYSIKSTFIHDSSKTDFVIFVRKGVIDKVAFTKEDVDERINSLFNSLKGIPHHPIDLLKLLHESGFSKSTNISDQASWRYLNCFF